MPTATPSWTFASVNSGYRRDISLSLIWEISGDPLTDDYTTDEITADELWGEWRRRYNRDEAAERLYGPGAHRIWWFVKGDGVLEGAPFQDWRGVPFPDEHNFLKSFTWPLNTKTGERLRWSSLPVEDKLWRKGRGDKGGFIQEVTGWKPGPWQAFVNVPQLEQLAGLAG